jgi:site-specific DNA-methyltransferase (adenine-specific)
MREIGRPELGTSLKPAWEPICLARKPLSEKTVAANCLRWGTGAINVGACRIGTEAITVRGGAGGNVAPWQLTRIDAERVGRFPANLCHDGSEEVLAAFPVTSSGSGNKNVRNRDNGNTIGDGLGKGYGYGIGGDSGSAARFYYSAKASKADRANSKHPTVKPVKLMQWLVRLITPPGGTTLDPFAGSGTTGAAAFLEGFNAVLIEREEEYQADIERRIGSLEPAAPAAPDLFACA